MKGECDDIPRGNVKESPRSQGSGKDPSSTTSWISSSVHDWDISEFAGADLLSEMVRISILLYLDISSLLGHDIAGA